MPIHKTRPRRILAKCERCVIETMISNSLIGMELFYRLNEQFVWFESYLTKRSQLVRMEDAVSDSLPLNFGARQGSILGPVVFTVYVNDLLSVPKHCKSSGYVDDTSDITDASNELNQVLLEISRWCSENSLLINPDKT